MRAWQADWGTAIQIECSELACEMSVTETSASLRAANNRSAVPGTPIMPAPSRLTMATSSIEVTPLIPSSASLRDEIRLLGCGQKGVPDVNRNPIVHGRPHGLRVYHFRAEVGQLHRFVIRQRTNNLCLRNTTGIAAHTPSTSVQMVRLSALASAANIAAEKSLPLRPSVLVRPLHRQR